MLDDRFWAKVDRGGPDDCWVWMANRNNHGYGLFRPGGTAPKALAHRLSFAEAYGSIPAGRLVLHSCDNPSCVNPAHLRLGDHRDNSSDITLRARRNPNPRRGGSNPSSSASDDTVAAIRRAYVSGASFSEMVQAFRLPLPTIKEYCTGRSFGHLYDAEGGISRADMKAAAARRRRNGAKITADDAADIRAALAAGESGRSVALRYGIHFGTVSDIKTGKIWPVMEP